MKTAVIFNKAKARDSAKFLAAGRSLARLLGNCEIVVCEGYGDAFLPKARAIASEPGPSYKESLYRAVEALADEDPFLIATVGGDGLASYTAFALNRIGARIPILGVAAGTANVGPIAVFTPEELGSMVLTDFEVEEVSGLRVDLDGEAVAYAFNDLVLGNTLLATIDGRIRNISALGLADESTVVEAVPGRRIAREDFQILKNGWAVPPPFPPAQIGQIIASPLQFDRLYGRAVFGTLCGSGGDPRLGAVLISDTPIVDASLIGVSETAEFKSGAHLLFSAGESIVFTGLDADAHAIVDGNPFPRRGEQKIGFVLETSAAMAFRRR